MDAQKVYVVIPNWNGEDRIRACLDSLKTQAQEHTIVVVDNGSVDKSVDIIEKHYSDAALIRHAKNKGFAGGVNAGIRYAMEYGARYVALLNNDAVADENWLKNLIGFLDENPKVGIATSKIVDDKKTHLDSTGDLYTIWGLPYPRGRGEAYSDKYDTDTMVFGASGGASMYRIKMLKEIGLFDEDFFAYYEDVDISFRAQLAGWKVGYVPQALVYHEIGATSGAIKGFTTYQTLKNLPLLLWKNVPWALMPKVWPRLVLAYGGLVFSALSRGQIGPVLKALAMGTVLWPKKLVQRYQIQQKRKVSVAYIDSMIIHDLPPNAAKLRRLRSGWWKMRGKRA
jgi:GT2 family glycosyltransferase